jgi:hypothetical protein
MKASAKGGIGIFKASCEVQGKVTSSRDHTRATNQTAKYQVSVKAARQPQPEGLSRLLDELAKCVAPVSVAAKGPLAGQERND